MGIVGILPGHPGQAGTAVEAPGATAAGGGHVLWVRPWSEVNLPSLPPGAGTLEAFLLHALLVHAGLPDAMLPRLVSVLPGEMAKAIGRLAATGLIRAEGGTWEVTPLGHPAVRQHLRIEGCLVDPL